MHSRTSFSKLLAGAALAVTMVAACSSGGTAAPSTSATVVSTTTASGAVVAAGSNQMTVYTFTKDTANSGTSACTGGCLTTWPALTVPAGATPTAGTGLTGKLGTITRSDNSALQVTYNGMPLYFFSKDTKPGDTNGHYTNWNLVTP